MKYTIDCDKEDCCDEGSSAEFYWIKENKNLGFKQFRDKKYATSAYNKQKLLNRFGLAPKVYGSICKLPMKSEWYDGMSGWGYITECAKVLDEKIMKKRLKEIQSLVENIHKKTKLKFWDCHYWNVGYIKRNNKAKLVCIDTGSESFDRDANAWGFNTPGPKCDFCNKYQCKCSNGFWSE